MAVALESFVSRINPNPNPRRAPIGLLRHSGSSSVDFLRLRPSNGGRARAAAAPLLFSPKGLDRRRRVVSSAASQEDSKHSDIEVEHGKTDIELGSESQEAWNKMVESLKEQLVKVQGMSEEAYEVYSKKALVILKEASEELKVQSEKARRYSSKVASEISVQGKEYISLAAEKSPDVDEIVKTFESSASDLKEPANFRDFHVGIPYGAVLSVGGFLSFMLTGSISAIRFGIILGGALLALSVSSLRSWKRRETSPVALKGQAAIAAIIFLHELVLLFQRSSFLSFLTTLIRINIDVPRRGSSLDPGPESHLLDCLWDTKSHHRWTEVEDNAQDVLDDELTHGETLKVAVLAMAALRPKTPPQISIKKKGSEVGFFKPAHGAYVTRKKVVERKENGGKTENRKPKTENRSLKSRTMRRTRLMKEMERLRVWLLWMKPIRTTTIAMGV
ncbi:hypothetical protein Sjap_014351 [Stephania japonica]|uniref:Protein FATTY ACID EXPORT 3, chloroplastic n=1 Tax=Stephania japonica TaxID=461633 RepID=A0AAP0NZW9_9MAGN